MGTRSDIITLQNATAFNAGDLNGTVAPIGEESGLAIWFTPAGGYDGTVNFEASPDGVVWIPIAAYNLHAAAPSRVILIATPTAAMLFVTSIPSNFSFRARMSGGTTGSLTVKAKRTHLIFGL